MLLNLREYHRPAEQQGRPDLDSVLDLLSRPGINTLPLAGGDALVGSSDPRIEAVVDLQGLGLDTITASEARVEIGAMATRSAVAEHRVVKEMYNSILADGAHGWSGSVQRNRATVGGALAAAASNDPLVVALLACNATVLLYTRSGLKEIALVDFIAGRAEILAAPALVTGIKIERPSGGTGAALASVARTPGDAPIVVVAGCLALRDGRVFGAALALGGAAAEPIRLLAAEQALLGQVPGEEAFRAAGDIAARSTHPKGDFRGSAEYRQAMAGVLTQRALGQAWARIDAA